MPLPRSDGKNVNPEAFTELHLHLLEFWKHAKSVADVTEMLSEGISCLVSTCPLPVLSTLMTWVVAHPDKQVSKHSYSSFIKSLLTGAERRQLIQELAQLANDEADEVAVEIATLK